MWESRIELLEKAIDALKEYEEQKGATSAVSRPLRAQIRHCLHVLRDDMVTEILSCREDGDNADNEEVPVKGSTRWLDMFFRLADYTYQKRPTGPVAKQPKTLLLSKKTREESREPTPESHVRGKAESKKWWTIGEVADHIFMSDLWVLAWNGRDFLVYDVTGN